MSDRPTPETDYEQKIDSGDTWPLFEFARRLERERDEAREQLDRICRDGFGYQDTIGGEACADYVLRKLTEERELARELRDALIALDEAPQDDHYEPSMKEIDAWVIARAALTKAKEVLP